MTERRCVHVGTAGWGLPRHARGRFPAEGSYLERYAARFAAVEINSSFYRQHRRVVYQRWGARVPPDFRFAVKMHRAITHDQRLVAVDVLLDVFLDDVDGLGERLGPILVQLPPSLAFDEQTVSEFLSTLRARFPGHLVLEPRHESWAGREVDALLAAWRVARVGADPARWPEAALPGGAPELVYLRLHGSPRMYYSEYQPDDLRRIATLLNARMTEGAQCWCVFDNTTLGWATPNALDLASLVERL